MQCKKDKGEFIMSDNRQILTAMMNVDYAPALISKEEISAKSCMAVPLTKIAALGAAFSPITTTIENVVAGGAGQQLYALNPRGYTGQLAAFKDGSGFLFSKEDATLINDSVTRFNDEI